MIGIILENTLFAHGFQMNICANLTSKYPQHHKDRFYSIKNGVIYGADGAILWPNELTVDPTDQIKWPNLRAWLIHYLYGFTDKDYQIKNWVDSNYPHALWDSIQEPWDFISQFSRMSMLDQITALVGYVFYDLNEALAVADMDTAFSSLMLEHDADESDDHYLNCPTWQALMDQAKLAYTLMRENDKTHGPIPH